MSSNPPAAAAAAPQDDDETLARKWAALEQLTQVYGFDLAAAKQAIDVVGPNVETACAFILDSGLGVDQGGPVVPIDSCPHLDLHAQLSASDLEASFDPKSTICTHVEAEKGKGRAKADMDETTGVCAATENWLCLDCGAVRCSRYANGHGLIHWEATKSTGENGVGHCVALSLGDLSVWCHACAAYVHHPSLQPILQHVENLKFGDSKQAAAAAT